MVTVSTTNDWRFGVRHSRMFVQCWSAEPQYAHTQREKLAYAMALGKPIRIVTLGTTPLPDDLCVGYDDFQSARCADPEAIGPQVLAWLEALKQREPPSAEVADA